MISVFYEPFAPITSVLVRLLAGADREPDHHAEFRRKYRGVPCGE